MTLDQHKPDSFCVTLEVAALENQPTKQTTDSYNLYLM